MFAEVGATGSGSGSERSPRRLKAMVPRFRVRPALIGRPDFLLLIFALTVLASGACGDDDPDLADRARLELFSRAVETSAESSLTLEFTVRMSGDLARADITGIGLVRVVGPEGAAWELGAGADFAQEDNEWVLRRERSAASGFDPGNYELRLVGGGEVTSVVTKLDVGTVGMPRVHRAEVDGELFRVRFTPAARRHSYTGSLVRTAPAPVAVLSAFESSSSDDGNQGSITWEAEVDPAEVEASEELIWRFELENAVSHRVVEGPLTEGA